MNRHLRYKSYIFLLCLGLFLSCFADNADTPITVCFTPGGNCTEDVVDAINKVHQLLLIQAYQFTSAPIAQAVVNAKRRGVNVKVILDKSQYKLDQYSTATFLSHAEIPVWIDYKPNIAHNKVMILDNTTVITGSFNFTKNAQEHNAENLLIIRSPTLAHIYAANWQSRLKASASLEDYQTLKETKSAHNYKTKHTRKRHERDFHFPSDLFKG